MAITDIPTVTEIKNRIIADVESSTNQTIPANKLSLVRLFAGALASAFRLLYQLALWTYKQAFTQTQAIEALRLEGENLGVDYQYATFAVIQAAVTGSAGTVPGGTTFFGSNLVTYRVDSTTAIPGDVQMTALTPGTVGNLSIGDELTLSSPTPGIDTTATVSTVTTTAEDDEEIEVYRNRVAIRKRTKYIYGTPAGYALSGLEAPGFTWVGPYADATITNQVNVYGRVDLSFGTDGIPTASQLIELENYLQYENGDTTAQLNRRPICDDLNVLAASNTLFDITVTVQGANLALKDEIEAAIREHAQTYEPFITGVTDTRNDTLTATALSVVANSVAADDGGIVVDVAIFDVAASSFVNSYILFGGTFALIRNVTFIDIL